MRDLNPEILNRKIESEFDIVAYTLEYFLHEKFAREDWDEIAEVMRWRGWEKQATKQVYYSPGRKYILKNAYFNHKTPPEGAIKTVFYGRPVDNKPNEFYQWCLQPVVQIDADSVEKAWKFYMHLDKKLGTGRYDIHTGNVGFYEGKPVIFDW